MYLYLWEYKDYEYVENVGKYRGVVKLTVSNDRIE
ncbi:hypothetical protein HNQ54_002262 [Anaerocolumna cellulosilytica]|nr:hypothetical protein [Anaerocolumna cellulosilytica]